MREFHLFCQFKTSGQICQSAHVSNILTQSKKNWRLYSASGYPGVNLE